MAHDLDALLDRFAELVAEKLAASLNGDAPAPANDMLTPEQAAALLKTDRRFVYRHADELGAVHLTRRKLRIPRAALQRYIKRSR